MKKKKPNIEKIARAVFVCINILFVNRVELFAGSNNPASYFISNKGQWPNEVIALHKQGNCETWITSKGLNLTFISKGLTKTTDNQLQTSTENFRQLELGHRVLLNFEGSNSEFKISSRGKQQGYYNYFIGNNPEKFQSFVPLYNELVLENFYNGIDLRYYIENNSLRFDFIVHPFADPNQIKFCMEGTDKIDNNGSELIVYIGEASFKISDLHVLQSKKEITSSFKRGDQNTFEFAINSYDPNKELIIDPIIFSTYIGGTYNEYLHGELAVDRDGNVYITGRTASSNYDVTPGSFQIGLAGTDEGFVTKLKADGKTLVFSSFIGGSQVDNPTDIAIDTAGYIYICGETQSGNFPITSGVLQSSLTGDYDGFITKIRPDGSGLVYSTYLGGTAADKLNAIAINSQRNVFVVGTTKSSGLTTSAGCYQSAITNTTNSDVFAAKIDTNASSILKSTYLGGTYLDAGNDIAVDVNDNVYIAGTTMSVFDFDITTGAFQTTHAGNKDGFITKLNNDFSTLVYSTLIGGTSDDEITDLALDTGGYVYVTGYTKSNNFKITTGAYQTTFNPGVRSEAFVTKVNKNGTQLVYSTYLGGSQDEFGNDIAVSDSGYAYVVGLTKSTDFDTTSNAIQKNNAGSDDVFFSKINANGTGLLYSTYWGGSGAEDGQGIALDRYYDVYLSGITSSSNFYTTSGSFQTSISGGGFGPDGFVTKLGFGNTSLSDKAINELINKSLIDFYPNPNNGYLTVISGRKANLIITDVSGRIMGIYNLKEPETHLFLDLDRGVYFVYDQEKNFMGKLVKN